MLSPTGFEWGRSYYGGIIFIIISLLLNYPDNTIELKKYRNIYVGMYSIVICCFLITFVKGVCDIKESNSQLTIRYNYLTSQKEKGNLNPVYPTMDKKNSTRYPAYSNDLSHVTEDENAKNNISTAKYFGLNSVRAVSERDWLLIYRNGYSDLMKIRNLSEYLTKIEDNQYLVLFVGHSPQLNIDEQLRTQFETIFPGFSEQLTTNKVLKAVKFDQGQQLLEAKDKVSFKFKGDNITLRTDYVPDSDSSVVQITINGKEYARNTHGGNIVVLNSKTGKVMDAIGFDLSVEQPTCFR